MLPCMSSQLLSKCQKGVPLTLAKYVKPFINVGEVFGNVCVFSTSFTIAILGFCAILRVMEMLLFYKQQQTKSKNKAKALC